MENKSFNFDLIDLNFNYMGDITSTNENNQIHVWVGFKLVNYWEIKQYTGKKILFWNDESINKKSNLLNRILNNSEYINLPYNNECYQKLNKFVTFYQDFNVSDFKIFTESITQETQDIVLIDSSVTNKYKKLLTDLSKMDLLVFSINNYFKFLKLPKFLNLEIVINKLATKNIKIYYVGKKINLNTKSNIDYYFTDIDKTSSGFLSVATDKSPNINTHFLYRKMSVPEPKLNYIHKKVDINPIKLTNNFIIDTIEEKSKIIPIRNLKKYINQVNNKEYPDINQINKLLFLINDLPILIENGGDYVDYLVSIIINLSYQYVVYYNGILINNKLNSDGSLNYNKINKEFLLKEKNNKCFYNKLFKIEKNEYDLIFYNMTDPELINIYQKLPYPKILNSVIIPHLWKDDRNIISIPSNLFLDIISSGIIKNQKNEIIKKPERFFTLEPFLPNIYNQSSIKEEFLCDLAIGIVCNSTNEKVEINLLKQIIEINRNKFNKDIYLVVYGEYKDNEYWVINRSKNNFKGLDMIIFLEEENIYQLDYFILQNLSMETPIYLSKSKINEEYFGISYSGFYPEINDDIGKILDFKKFFSEKINNLIIGHRLKEKDMVNLLKYSWNKNIYKKYENQFANIISFLNSKNYKRNEKLINLLNEDDGFNFYYSETISNNNLSQIYQNVENFFDKIKHNKNILLISSDYPGYGGASSLNNEIAKILRLKGHEVKEIYYIFDREPNKKEIINKFMENYFEEKSFFNKDNIRVTDENNFISDLHKMEFSPDLVILKNHLNGKPLLDKFTNVMYLVAGIFKNELNKFFYDLNNDEIKKYTNNQVINLLKNPKIKGICNSVHTQKILKETFSIETELSYVNFIPKYPQKIPEINIEKRPYTYGIICSNFNRPIKNLDNIITDIKENLKTTEKVILIGKNSHKYSATNIEAIDLVPSYLIDDYLRKIKNVIVNSYYESCSNLVIQAKFNGCNVLRQSINNIENSIKILITSTQYPYYGGSSTNAYKLIKYLRNNNYNVAGCFYHPKHLDKNMIDPENFTGIYQLRDNSIKKIFIDELAVTKTKSLINNYLGGYPDLIFSFNYYTPILSKKLFPYAKNFYFIVGNPVLTVGTNNIIKKNISVQTFLKEHNIRDTEYDKNIYQLEEESIKLSTGLIIDQGKLNIDTVSKIYPKYNYLLNDFFNYGINILKENLKQRQLNNEQKEYDLIAISSNWNRPVKNPTLLYNIFKQLPHYKKIIIGKQSNMFDHLPNTITLNLMSYDSMLSYLSKSKVLVVPSLSETGSNTIIESFYCKCQVITSKNVGYNYLLKDYQLCQDVYDIEEWKNKINFLLNNNLPIQKINTEDYHYKFLNYIKTFNKERTPRVLIVCGDKPYYGGAGTNTYNIIKLLRENNISSVGLFISYQNEGLNDPENLGDIHHIYLDDSIEIRLKSWKLENNYNNFDIIFCKNYKVFILIKKLYPQIPIIYSPSGLRQITAEISGRNTYYQYLKDKNISIINKDITLVEDTNWYKFIMKNDRYLENYVLASADYLLPNSKITWDIITSNYSEFRSKTLAPTYLTNINFVEKSNYNFSKRKYHFGFIATNWKRATKNLELVKKIIANPQMKEFKFLIIGMNHTLKKTPNITVLNHISHDKLIKELQSIKTIIIPSYYDSNPNILIEAIYSGCNVVSSLNAGNCENLRRELIVLQPDKINNWINCLLKSITKSYPFLGQSKEHVSDELVRILKYYSNQIDSVGIYKVNPLWDTTDKLKIDHDFNYSWLNETKDDFEEHKGRRTNILKNIYLHMYSNIVEKMGFKHNHFIFVDETIKECVRFTWKNINIWILNTAEQVLSFNKAKFYFVRGHYPNFYNKLINDNAYAILYPATSLKYQYNLINNQKMIKRDLEINYRFRQPTLYKKFNMVLVHEDKTYEQQYIHNKKILLEKFALESSFYYLDVKERKYDIIMVAQALQKTKNHQVMFNFIRYCSDNKISIKIAYVSNKDILQKTYPNFYEDENIVDFYDNLDPVELNKLYNNSRVNLILSNRDCVPRVIPESLNSGCYNIATDLLSDGKFYYDGIFGEIISLDFAEVELLESSNISYVSNPFLFKIILKKINKKFDHKRISEEFMNKYNLDNMVCKIVNNI